MFHLHVSHLVHLHVGHYASDRLNLVCSTCQHASYQFTTWILITSISSDRNHTVCLENLWPSSSFNDSETGPDWIPEFWLKGACNQTFDLMSRVTRNRNLKRLYKKCSWKTNAMAISPCFISDDREPSVQVEQAFTLAASGAS